MINRLNPAEIEFLAEKQTVKITPKFTQNNVIYLISGNIGPFTSGLPTEVPLWLAINLRQRLKCDVILPHWLSIAQIDIRRWQMYQNSYRMMMWYSKGAYAPSYLDLYGARLDAVQAPDALEEKKTAESDSEFFTTPPHSHYMEMSKLLLQYAVDDVPKADELRTLVKDIWDLRIAKLRKSIDSFMSSDSMVAKVNNLTLMEMNNVREFLSAALSVRQKLKTNTNLNFTLGDSQLIDSGLNDSRFGSNGSSSLHDTLTDTI